MKQPHTITEPIRFCLFKKGRIRCVLTCRGKVRRVTLYERRASHDKAHTNGCGLCPRHLFGYGLAERMEPRRVALKGMGHGGGGSCGCTGPARTANETQGKHGRGKGPRNGGAVRKRAAFFVAYPPWKRIFLYRQSEARFWKRLCYRKWLMLFSLKVQDNRKNVLAVDPAKRKTGEKGCIFIVLWRWSNHKL